MPCNAAKTAFSQKPVKLGLGSRIAFACAPFERLAIQNGNDTAPIMDRAFVLQFARRKCHPGALNAQHHCEEFLRKEKFVPFHSVMSHQ